MRLSAPVAEAAGAAFGAVEVDICEGAAIAQGKVEHSGHARGTGGKDWVPGELEVRASRF